MLNRHGTRLDIGTADDIAELNIAEARRRKEAAAGSPVVRPPPHTLSTTLATASAGAGGLTRNRATTSAGSHVIGSYQRGAPPTRTSMTGYRSNTGAMFPGTSPEVTATAGIAGVGDGAGRHLPVDHTPPTRTAAASPWQSSMAGGGTPGATSVSSTTTAAAAVTRDRHWQQFMHQQTQQTRQQQQQRDRVLYNSPGDDCMDGHAYPPSPLGRRGGADGTQHGNSNPFAGLDNVDEEEELQRPSRASGRLPPPR